MINLSEKEEWRPVEEYPGYYVSDKGRVIGKKGTILKQVSKDNDYLIVGVCRDKKCKSAYVHRLVAQAFIPNPEEKPFVNHIDGDKTNNSVNNLEWVTAWENSDHAYRNGLSSWKVKLYPEQIEEIRRRRMNGESSVSLAKDFNVSPISIRRHCEGIDPRKISEKERNEIRQFYKDNYHITEICNHFNRSETAVRKCCRGIDREPVMTNLPKLTDSDILKIKHLREQGLSYSKIGKIFNRSDGSIRYYCNKKLDTA